jgi:hypothetical protein
MHLRLALTPGLAPKNRIVREVEHGPSDLNADLDGPDSACATYRATSYSAVGTEASADDGTLIFFDRNLNRFIGVEWIDLQHIYLCHLTARFGDNLVCAC